MEIPTICVEHFLFTKARLWRRGSGELPETDLGMSGNERPLARRRSSSLSRDNLPLSPAHNHDTRRRERMRNMANSLTVMEAVGRFRRGRSRSGSMESLQQSGNPDQEDKNANELESREDNVTSAAEDNASVPLGTEDQERDEASESAAEVSNNDSGDEENDGAQASNDEGSDHSAVEGDQVGGDNSAPEDDDEEDYEDMEDKKDDDGTAEVRHPGIITALCDVIIVLVRVAVQKLLSAVMVVWNMIKSAFGAIASGAVSVKSKFDAMDHQTLFRRLMACLVATFIIGILSMLPRDLEGLGANPSHLLNTSETLSPSTSSKQEIATPTTGDIGLDPIYVAAIIRDEMQKLQSDLSLGEMEGKVESLVAAIDKDKSLAEKAREAHLNDIKTALEDAVKKLEEHAAAARDTSEDDEAHAKEFEQLLVSIKEFSHASEKRLEAAEASLQDSQKIAQNAIDSSTAAQLACQASEASANAAAAAAAATANAGNSQNSNQECRNLTTLKSVVDKRLELYAADKIGLPDHALEVLGSHIVHRQGLTGLPYTPFSKSYNPLQHLFSRTRPPEAVIDSDTTIGNCYACLPHACNVTIALHKSIVPTRVSIDHISPQVAIDIRSAPKDFTVWGLRRLPEFNGDEEDHVELGSFAYDALLGQQVQTFELVPHSHLLSWIKIQFSSNHDHPDFTCVYRVRIHE